MRLAHISHEINPSCRAPREATQQATELTTGPEKPWKTQRLYKCLRAPCDEEKRWCLTQGCITNTSKNVKSEIYCLLVNWWLMKGYFEAEKSVSVRHKSQKRPRGNLKGAGCSPYSSPDALLCHSTRTSQSVPMFSESFSRLRVAVLAQYVKATGWSLPSKYQDNKR